MLVCGIKGIRKVCNLPYHLLPYLLETESLTEPRACHFSQADSQQAQAILPSQHPQCSCYRQHMAMPAFLCVLGAELRSSCLCSDSPSSQTKFKQEFFLVIQNREKFQTNVKLTQKTKVCFILTLFALGIQLSKETRRKTEKRFDSHGY